MSEKTFKILWGILVIIFIWMLIWIEYDIVEADAFLEETRNELEIIDTYSLDEIREISYNAQAIFTPAPVERVQVVETVPGTPFTQAEIDMIVSLVHYEAGNQDVLGKKLVVDTVLNRLHSDRFPDSVDDVIYQKLNGRYQYSVVGKYDMDTSECTLDEYQVVLEEISNQQNTEVIFFRTGDYMSCGEPLFKYGNHYFSGLKGENINDRK